MKIPKSCSLHHSPDLVNQPTPLVFSQAVQTLSFLAADRLFMRTAWWLHEAEEIAEHHNRTCLSSPRTGLTDRTMSWCREVRK